MIDINKLQEKYKFMRSENNKILIKPLSKYSFQTSDVDETFIEITNEEFIGLITRQKQFNEELNGVIDFVKGE